MPRLLTDIASECREVYEKCPDKDLWGYSLLDLMADNVDASLADLKSAIIVSGIYGICNARLKKQIDGYGLDIRPIPNPDNIPGISGHYIKGKD